MSRGKKVVSDKRQAMPVIAPNRAVHAVHPTVHGLTACGLNTKRRRLGTDGATGCPDCIAVLPGLLTDQLNNGKAAKDTHAGPDRTICGQESQQIPGYRCVRGKGHNGAHYFIASTDPGFRPMTALELAVSDLKHTEQERDTLAEMVAQAAARHAGTVPPNGRIHATVGPMSDLQKVVAELLLEYVSADPYGDPAEFMSDLRDDLGWLDPASYMGDPGGLTPMQKVEATRLYTRLIGRVRVAEAVGSRRYR